MKFLFVLLIFCTVVNAQAVTIRTAAKRFTEHKIITEITRQFLRTKGYKVRQLRNKSTRAIRKNLLDNKIDFYWEYTGTAFLTFHKQLFTGQTPNEIYQFVKQADKKNGLVWLKSSKINNNYALALRPTLSKMINNISEIIYLLDQADVSITCNFEFCKTWGKMEDLQTFYGFRFNPEQIKINDLGKIYQFLKNNDTDIGLVFSSDAKLYQSGIKVLIDDKNFFPSFRLTPVIRRDFINKHPSIKRDLNRLSGFLNTKIMIELNAQVSLKKQPIRQVARRFLLKNQLI